MQFVDTNVLLYAYDVTAGSRHERARALVGALGRTRTGALSVQVLQEFYVNAVRKISSPLPPDMARKRVVALSRWTAHAPSTHDVLAAMDIANRTRISFRDAMIIQSASALGCDTLWSEDLNTGQIFGAVRIENPFAEV